MSAFFIRVLSALEFFEIGSLSIYHEGGRG